MSESQRTEKAILAGGCFWGMQDLIRKRPGVITTRVGYTGGNVPDPSYERVCRHRTGHAEAVEVWFDPAQVSYAELLQAFWRIHNPTTFSGELIASMLKLRGIDIKGRIKTGRMPRADVVAVATHFSRPLGEIISTLNKYSNNFMAEQILKTLGAETADPPGSWDKGVGAIRKFLTEIGIPDGSFVLGNGSGLNDINRVTPAQITRVLGAMHSRFEVEPEFVASLAVAGSSGTIIGRFENSPAIARLRAKTGSLNGVSALSGYVVTQNDKVLAFSVMMNDYYGRARTMWRIQDRIGITLARYRSSEVVARP
jgi:D-alanyl-D-alanine carboxypeptidase/D-alanyl-D-alanine-endopeptidase (penicillin-binding protein 4)